MKQTLQQDDENTLLQCSENPEVQRSSLKGWTLDITGITATNTKKSCYVSLVFFDKVMKSFIHVHKSKYGRETYKEQGEARRALPALERRFHFIMFPEPRGKRMAQGLVGQWKLKASYICTGHYDRCQFNTE